MSMRPPQHTQTMSSGSTSAPRRKRTAQQNSDGAIKPCGPCETAHNQVWSVPSAWRSSRRCKPGQSPRSSSSRRSALICDPATRLHKRICRRTWPGLSGCSGSSTPQPSRIRPAAVRLGEVLHPSPRGRRPKVWPTNVSASRSPCRRTCSAKPRVSCGSPRSQVSSAASTSSRQRPKSADRMLSGQVQASSWREGGTRRDWPGMQAAADQERSVSRACRPVLQHRPG